MFKPPKTAVAASLSSRPRTAFRTVSEFRQLLGERNKQFTRCLTEKLMTYALGRELNVGDRPDIDAIVNQVDDESAGLQDLIRLIVLGKPFQNN